MSEPSFDEARRSLGTGPSETRRGLQRARLLKGRTPSARAKVIALAVVMAAVSLIVFVVKREAPSLVRDGAGPVALGSVLVASGVRTLEFDEGSQLTLRPGAELRLEAVDESRVELVLQRGRLEATVTKGTGRTWRYHAGPWTIRVVGTQLTIDWEPKGESVQVSVTEGAVEVTGPGGVQRLVRAGESLQRSTPQPVTVKPPAPPVGEGEVLPEEKEPSVRAPLIEGRKPAPPQPEPELTPTVPERMTWQQLLASGRRLEALDEASASGVFAGQLDDVEALELADAARLERKGDLARVLLARVLERGGPDAAEAAFLLGRLELDSHRAQAAQRFFARSVSLAPEGPFVEQARGRLLEALLELEDLPAAREVARDYLAHHPGGAWEPIAAPLVRSAPP